MHCKSAGKLSKPVVEAAMLYPAALSPLLPAWASAWLDAAWDRRDRRMDGRVLMDSPWPTALICITYVYLAKASSVHDHLRKCNIQ